MNLPVRHTIVAAALATLFAAAPSRAQGLLPPNFVQEDAVPGDSFVWPTAIAFINDNRLLVAEQDGILWIVNNGVRHPTPVIDLRDDILNDFQSDRGLLGIAVDPDFATSRRVYLMYTVDPDTNGVDTENDAYGRLVSYQMSTTDTNAIDPATRQVLFGRIWPEGPASGSITHTVGGLRWGRDGSLLVSIGDGAQYTQMDAGGLDPGMFGAGKTDPSEDIGAFRSQDINSLCGKILRIDPATGHGYPSNPYWDGDPMSVRSRVWAYGLRNPFRFGVRPWTGSFDPADGDPGTLYIVDVGWETYEELDVASTGGLNFGWPCREGFHATPQYPSATPDHHDCSTLGTAENPALATDPIADWHHTNPNLSSPSGYTGSAGVGGAFYDGFRYPVAWRGNFFYGDYGGSWIRAARTTESDQLLSVPGFGTEMDGPVDFAPHPSSRDLVYIAVYTGQIYRIRYTGSVAVEPGPADGLDLSAAFPNPASGPISLRLDLPREAREVRFAVHDIAGRRVWSAPPRPYAAGSWSLVWPGVTDSGLSAPPGVYLASVVADGRRMERRVLRIR